MQSKKSEGLSKKTVGRPKIYANPEEAYKVQLERRKEKRKNDKDAIERLTQELIECKEQNNKLSNELFAIKQEVKKYMS